MTEERRYNRNIRLFGADGQARIAGARLTIVGLGGLGSFVAQEAAHLGVRSFGLIDGDVVTESSLNRLVGAIPDDAVAATPKVEVAERLIRSIAPEATVDIVRGWLTKATARSVLASADVLIGCLDDDYARLQLTEIASSLERPYVDLASDVAQDGSWYGGRVLFSEPRKRCPLCLGELDPDELRLGGLTPELRAAHDRSYGVDRGALDRRGASVVSINGVVASLGMTELMAHLTGLRQPAIALTYRAETGVVLRRRDEPVGPCPYCRPDPDPWP